jgi:hypothetical protein
LDFIKLNIEYESDFKLYDFVISINETNIYDGPYLWASLAFPMPAKNLVRSYIYWDKYTKIEDDEISVYNIFGDKVAGREKIFIDRLTSDSGILNWDCSSVPTGIYLIYIKHGSKSWTLKVLVNK